MKNVIFLKRRINIKFPSLCFSIYHQSHFSLSSQSNSIKRAVKDSCLCIFFFFLTSHLFSTSAMRSGNEWLSRTSQTSIASPPTPWRTLRRLLWQNDSSFLIALPYSLPSPPSPRLLQWRWIRGFSSPLSFPVPNSLPSDLTYSWLVHGHFFRDASQTDISNPNCSSHMSGRPPAIPSKDSMGEVKLERSSLNSNVLLHCMSFWGLL